MAQAPSIPKGTRDFSPLQTRRRDYIFDTIRSVFALHGYLPIETPAIENLSTLLGKYGEEGDKLLFRILNSGDFLNKVEELKWESMATGEGSARLGACICEKGLRYDLTVPFARYVVQHRNDLCFPFKRYQMQPVWRADRPQKGRYREFYQCDADVVGSDSLWEEAELAQMVEEIFSILHIPVLFKINNRKILAAMAASIHCQDKLTEMTVAIDKLDKMGLAAVEAEMAEKGISAEALSILSPILSWNASFEEKIERMKGLFEGNEIGLKGVAEMEELFSYLQICAPHLKYEWDLTLARGLNYYTGAIFEVKALGVEMGSISGGGRYDDLTGVFGLQGVSGVGISFGADRIYDVLEGLSLFPDNLQSAMQVLFIHFGPKEAALVQSHMRLLRRFGISCDRYPDPIKLQKQLTYADRLQIPYVVLIGEEEFKNGRLSVKDMKSGEQAEMSIEELIEKLCQK